MRALGISASTTLGQAQFGRNNTAGNQDVLGLPPQTPVHRPTQPPNREQGERAYRKRITNNSVSNRNWNQQTSAEEYQGDADAGGQQCVASETKEKERDPSLLDPRNVPVAIRFFAH